MEPARGTWSDYYSPSPGEVDSALCGVCGTLMEARRNVNGPTGFAEAMAKHGHLHDAFSCPHREEEWHKRVRDLIDGANQQKCAAVREMYLAEANERLSRQGKEPYYRHPEWEKYWEIPKNTATPFKIQNRYQDSGWEDAGVSYGTAEVAIAEAYKMCLNPVANGMTRVVKDGNVLVTFPAGGYR